MINIRTTLPEAGNPYYNTKNSGGYSPCILGNYPYGSYPNQIGTPGINVLPNCVGWAVGVFNEYASSGNCDWLGSTNAELFIELARKQGLVIGQTPKPGAVMVWKGGSTYSSSDGAGHVAVVAQVHDANYLLSSESGWNSKKAMWLQYRSKGSGNWGQKSTYRFLGFIYHPDIVFELCPYAEPTKPFKKGAKGNNVRWLQWHLDWEGYTLDIDGSFGPTTDKATRDFQKKYHNEQADGWVGPTTRQLLKLHLPWNEGE